MASNANPRSGGRGPRPPRRDTGSTFIELLVAVVLLGSVVLGVLVALQATTVASTRDAEHARAFVLLHEASDAVFTYPRLSCLAGTESDLITHYSKSFDSGLTAPEGWGGVTPVIEKIEFLNASDSTGETVYSWGPLCFEGPVDLNGDGTVDEDFSEVPLTSQKITISVSSPDGSFTKLIETVKR
jgi:hypothetical protein